MDKKFTNNLKMAILNCIQDKCDTKFRNNSLACQGLGEKESRQAMLGERIDLNGENLRIAEVRIHIYF